MLGKGVSKKRKIEEALLEAVNSKLLILLKSNKLIVQELFWGHRPKHYQEVPEIRGGKGYRIRLGMNRRIVAIDVLLRLLQVKKLKLSKQLVRILKGFLTGQCRLRTQLTKLGIV